MPKLDKRAVEQRIRDLDPAVVQRYVGYWDSITPKTLRGRYHRWIFALLSSQTGWLQNALSYKAVLTMPWETKAELQEVLIGTRCGLYTSKVEGIWALHTFFCNQPESAAYVLGLPTHADWPGWRDHLVYLVQSNGRKAFPYAGQKIVSFAHELCWPRTSEVIAVDRHVADWYGCSINRVTPQTYREIEKHWVGVCKQHSYPPPLVRHILWDQDHNEENTRYWAYVFETDRADANRQTEEVEHTC